jgi:hypothetical protein
MPQTSNPLQQFFRQPAIYIRLPSDGQHWPPGSLDMPANHELPVYPMTAIDEITYRTPDALFNGQSTISVIQSCVPNVKNAWHMPGIDLNSVLIAIRVASYGHNMEVDSTCPSCESLGEYVTDLRRILDQMTAADYTIPIQQGDLEIYFRPLNYQQQNQSSLDQFEQQKILTAVPDSDLTDDEKIARMNQALVRITEMTIELISQSIAVIKTPTATVTATEHIKEFVSNCDRKLYNAIRDRMIDLRKNSEIPNMQIQCNNCDHEYEQQMTLDMVSFFDKAS